MEKNNSLYMKNKDTKPNIIHFETPDKVLNE